MKTADVVIVGAGGAGMAAALQAADLGVEKVIIVEPTPPLPREGLFGEEFNSAIRFRSTLSLVPKSSHNEYNPRLVPSSTIPNHQTILWSHNHPNTKLTMEPMR